MFFFMRQILSLNGGMKMSDYNGWRNWETWNLHLWLSNNEASQRACEAYCAARELRDAADGLQAMVNEEFDALNMPSSFFRDAVAASIGEVDWRELAAAFGAENA